MADDPASLFFPTRSLSDYPAPFVSGPPAPDYPTLVASSHSVPTNRSSPDRTVPYTDYSVLVTSVPASPTPTAQFASAPHNPHPTIRRVSAPNRTRPASPGRATPYRIRPPWPVPTNPPRPTWSPPANPHRLSSAIPPVPYPTIRCIPCAIRPTPNPTTLSRSIHRSPHRPSASWLLRSTRTSPTTRLMSAHPDPGPTRLAGAIHSCPHRRSIAPQPQPAHTDGPCLSAACQRNPTSPIPSTRPIPYPTSPFDSTRFWPNPTSRPNPVLRIPDYPVPRAPAHFGPTTQPGPTRYRSHPTRRPNSSQPNPIHADEPRLRGSSHIDLSSLAYSTQPIPTSRITSAHSVPTIRAHSRQPRPSRLLTSRALQAAPTDPSTQPSPHCIDRPTRAPNPARIEPTSPTDPSHSIPYRRPMSIR